MVERVMHFSDLTNEAIENPDEMVSIEVTQHPDLDQPVRLEARPEEVADLGRYAIDAVCLRVTPPGEDAEPTNYVLTANNFKKLSRLPMDQILAAAKPLIPSPTSRQRRSHNVTASGQPLINYNDPDFAGLPHKGRIGDQERVYVQANLELVNERRVAAGHEPINPDNPLDAKRYDLVTAEPAPEAPDTETTPAPQ